MVRTRVVDDDPRIFDLDRLRRGPGGRNQVVMALPDEELEVVVEADDPADPVVVDLDPPA